MPKRDHQHGAHILCELKDDQLLCNNSNSVTLFTKRRKMDQLN